ncbi:DUF3459 domain-containing protein, partial [Streptomyces sp. PT12]|uniref:DUF3459 domain-containing protein n=1 Tax=Streptomyces sp. PT12 TaxID=1510197 RepID=UPI000DE41EA2
SWLPQPPAWAALSVARQTKDPASTLELYRSALAARRAHAALGAGDAVRWLEAPDGVLAFRREGADGSAVVCAVNTNPTPVPVHGLLPEPGRPLLTSAPLPDPVVLPGDCAVWWESL